MKGKIIVFFSVLLVSIAAICSLTAFAAQEYYDYGTSTNFSKNYSTSVSKLSTWKKVGTMQSISNSYNGNYKYVHYQTFRYDADEDDFVAVEEAVNTGTARQLDAAVTSISNVTNVLARGGMGYTNVSSTGMKEYITLNVRYSNSVTLLPNEYL